VLLLLAIDIVHGSSTNCALRLGVFYSWHLDGLIVGSWEVIYLLSRLSIDLLQVLIVLLIGLIQGISKSSGVVGGPCLAAR